MCADLTAPVRVNLGRETTYSDQPQGEEATGGQASAQCASSLPGTRRAGARGWAHASASAAQSPRRRGEEEEERQARGYC